MWQHINEIHLTAGKPLETRTPLRDESQSQGLKSPMETIHAGYWAIVSVKPLLTQPSS